MGEGGARAHVGAALGRPEERRHPCLLGVAREGAGKDACAPKFTRGRDQLGVS
jgi:hypothetical protein